MSGAAFAHNSRQLKRSILQTALLDLFKGLRAGFGLLCSSLAPVELRTIPRESLEPYCVLTICRRFTTLPFENLARSSPKQSQWFSFVFRFSRLRITSGRPTTVITAHDGPTACSSQIRRPLSPGKQLTQVGLPKFKGISRVLGS